MTRAERIERIARELVAYAEEYQSMPFAHIAFLREALALPPDPVPRRLAVTDVMEAVRAAAPKQFKSDGTWFDAIANFLNARIFGGLNDDVT
jgi:hypothetical protein